MKRWVFLVFLLIPVLGWAQEGSKNALRFGDTNVTNKRPKYTAKGQKGRERRVLTIVKNTPEKTLAGNKCFEDYLTQLGFRYQIQSKSNPQYTPLKRYFHNVGVRFRTTLRNGPLWRVRLMKRRKECRELLHDYMG